MKANQVKAQQSKPEPMQCIQCHKTMTHPYGMWGGGATCSRRCEEQYEMRQRSIFAQGGYDDDLDDDA